MPSRYQYQAITGPVWRSAVAATLAWLPAGNAQPVRSRPPNPPSALIQPFTEAVNVAWNLQWQANALAPFRAARPSYDVSVLPAFQPPTGYNPAGLQWYSITPQPYRLQLLRQPDTGMFGTPVYDPQELQWSPDIAWPARMLVGIRTGSSYLNPLPIPPPAFDPAQFPYLTTPLVRGLLRPLVPALVQPITAALYRPERLEWIPLGRYPWRGLAPNRLGWIATDPLPHPVFIIALPLQIEDRSGFLYRLLDQSTKRYLVAEQSGIRIVTEDSGT